MMMLANMCIGFGKRLRPHYEKFEILIPAADNIGWNWKDRGPGKRRIFWLKYLRQWSHQSN